jgi:hypothetical protein
MYLSIKKLEYLFPYLKNKAKNDPINARSRTFVTIWPALLRVQPFSITSLRESFIGHSYLD